MSLKLSTLEKMKTSKTITCAVLVLTLVSLACLYLSFQEVDLPEATLEVITNQSNVECEPGIPCTYPEEVDFRIIVMTYNRAESLKKLLDSLSNIKTDGDTIALEIWIDRSKQQQIHQKTLEMAQSYEFKLGAKRVHVQKEHVGIYGQWIDTWRPWPGSKELAVFLEDDLTVSPLTWRYLKQVHSVYGQVPDCGGYTLQCEGVNTVHVKHRGEMKVDPKDHYYLYRLMGSWGFMPHPLHWAKFQDWFHQQSKKLDFHPYVPNIIITTWYKNFEGLGTQDSMWTMWYVYYTTENNLFTVYPNANSVFNNKGHCLVVHRHEKGLHYTGKSMSDASVRKKLLTAWSPLLEKFPEAIKRIDYDGKVIRLE